MDSFFQAGDLNVQQFDRVVRAFFEGSSDTERYYAQTALTEFQSHPNAWQVVDRILDQSPQLQSKFIALGILEGFTKVKWNMLPMEQRLIIRNYIIKLIIDNCRQSAGSAAYVNKLDLVLVQIVKKDWPTYWPTFVQEIVDSSLTDENICVNNMKILKYLSEEIFDYSDDYMTKARMHKLRTQLINEFSLIFELCKNVLLSTQQSNATNDSIIVTSTLETLLKFLSWVPRDVILQQNLLQLLKFQFDKGTNAQKILILQSFTEIVKMINDAEETEQKQHSDIISYILSMVYDTLLSHGQVNWQLDDVDDDLLKCLSVLLTSSLTYTFVSLISLDNNIVHTCLLQLIDMTFVSDDEIRKICLEYWKRFVLQSNKENNIHPTLKEVRDRLSSQLVSSMVQPDSTLYISPEDKDDPRSPIKREFSRLGHTERALSNLMHELLYHLENSHLLNNPVRRTISFLTPTWDVQFLKENRTHWDIAYKCMWASAAIVRKEAECDSCDNYAQTILLNNMRPLEPAEGISEDDDVVWVLLSGVCYIAQYCRSQFLIEHYQGFTYPLLKRLLQALTQPSMEESLKDFCCHAFRKLSAACKDCIVGPSAARLDGLSDVSLLEDMLAEWGMLDQQLNPTQTIQLYEAAGIAITALPNDQLQHIFLTAFMNTSDQLMAQAMNNPSTLRDTSLAPLRAMLNVLKINQTICTSTSFTLYNQQLARKQNYLAQAYTIASQYLSENNKSGAIQYNLMLQLRQQILELLNVYYASFHNTTMANIEDEEVMISSLSISLELIQIVIADFKNNAIPAEKKDPKVLTLLTRIVTTAKNPDLSPQLFQQIIDVEFFTALPFITSNFSDHPEIRQEFYQLLKALNECCFIQLFQTPNLFQLNMDSILWGTKHPLSEVSRLALQICLDMINSVSQLDDEDVSSRFFEQYYVRILTEILEILVDPDCRNGFEHQSQILARLLALVQEGEIYTRVFDPEQVANPLMSNVGFLQQYVLELFCNAFPLLQRDQIEVLVKGMFDYSDDLERFQKDIRDFLIDIREVGEAGAGEKREQEELNAELELLKSL